MATPVRKVIPKNEVSVSQVSLALRLANAKAKATTGGEGRPFIVSRAISEVSDDAIKKIIDVITHDLRVLRNEEDEDDYIFRPSDHAFETALCLVSDSHLLIETSPGKPFVSPDGSGGVRLEWTKNGRTVSLVIPVSPDHQAYIYHRCGDAHNAERNPSARTLADWLNWLIHG